jgi:competence protein ComGC
VNLRNNFYAILIVLAVIVLLALVFLPFLTGPNRNQPQVQRNRSAQVGTLAV